MGIKIIEIKLKFIQSNVKQNIDFIAYFPIFNGVIYKPIKVKIISGYFSDSHRKNISKDRKKNRDEKDILLKEISTQDKDGKYIINKEKVFFDDFKSVGLVSFIGKLTATNVNRHVPLFMKNTNIKKFKGINILKLFQNPKSLPKSGVSLLSNPISTITFDDFYNENVIYANNLLSFYLENILTCSISMPVIRPRDKNKTMEYYKGVALKEMVKRESQNVSSDSLIMYTFKKDLDFKNKYSEANRKCQICDIKHPNMLTASHILARSKCKTNEEKIDGNNGLWLCAGCDRAFDRILFTFDKDGKIIMSSQIEEENIFDKNFNLPSELSKSTKNYMEQHRGQFNDKFGAI